MNRIIALLACFALLAPPAFAQHTTAPGPTVSFAAGKSLTVNNTLTLAGTDGQTETFPSTSATIARTDAAQSFTGVQTFSSAPIVSALSNSVPVCTTAAAALTSTCTNLVTNAILAQAATNTVKGNATSGTANDTDLSVGSCSTSASALIWTTNTGFGCNTAVNAAQLGGATMAAPGAIGGTTPAAGTFTTLGANTQLNVNGKLALSATAPTIANGGGLGTVGTITGAANAFDVTAGTGAASVFVITLPAATNGWVCKGDDITTHSTSVSTVQQTVGTNNTTTVTMGVYSDVAALAAVGTGDHLRISCMAY